MTFATTFYILVEAINSAALDKVGKTNREKEVSRKPAFNV